MTTTENIENVLNALDALGSALDTPALNLLIAYDACTLANDRAVALENAIRPYMPITDSTIDDLIELLDDGDFDDFDNKI